MYGWRSYCALAHTCTYTQSHQHAHSRVHTHALQLYSCVSYSQEVSDEIVMTIGQAAEIAYQKVMCSRKLPYDHVDADPPSSRWGVWPCLTLTSQNSFVFSSFGLLCVFKKKRFLNLWFINCLGYYFEAHLKILMWSKLKIMCTYSSDLKSANVEFYLYHRHLNHLAMLWDTLGTHHQREGNVQSDEVNNCMLKKKSNMGMWNNWLGSDAICHSI